MLLAEVFDQRHHPNGMPPSLTRHAIENFRQRGSPCPRSNDHRGLTTRPSTRSCRMNQKNRRSIRRLKTRFDRTRIRSGKRDPCRSEGGSHLEAGISRSRSNLWCLVLFEFCISPGMKIDSRSFADAEGHQVRWTSYSIRPNRTRIPSISVLIPLGSLFEGESFCRKVSARQFAHDERAYPLKRRLGGVRSCDQSPHA